MTTGETWQFLRLAESEILMERRRFYIDNTGDILGVIRSIADEDGRGR